MVGVQNVEEERPLTYLETCLLVYQNSIGDLNLPYVPIDSPVLTFITWFIFFMHQFIALIILLNFLIAVISQSYDEVMSRRAESNYVHRCQMNFEMANSFSRFHSA